MVKNEAQQANRIADGRSVTPLKVTITASGDLDPAAKFWHHGTEQHRPIVYTTDSNAKKATEILGELAEVVQLAIGPACAHPNQRRHRTVLRHPEIRALYRGLIADGDALDMEIHRFRIIYNTMRPHQALEDQTPSRHVYGPDPAKRAICSCSEKMEGPGADHDSVQVAGEASIYCCPTLRPTRITGCRFR
ncbi:integrase core domain-containing protein [Nocardia brasiliensis]|uniref:integrase core domain-containing protein n=1 Tax=Nocardia brasiliensis TaxID=37326 RepID=UPI002458F411|nr:integrase core domain-containing protein [Nocardia brasiliensis]